MSYPGNSNTGGSWRTLDKGFICFNSGFIDNYGGHYNHNLELWSVFGNMWKQMDNRIILKNWGTLWQIFPNEAGSGDVPQEIVLALDPGRVSWVIIESNGWF